MYHVAVEVMSYKWVRHSEGCSRNRQGKKQTDTELRIGAAEERKKQILIC